MKTEIAVGDYVHLDTWKPGDKLWSEWVEQYPEEYNEVRAALKADEEILPAGKYTLEIDYPLTRPFREAVEFGNPLTREQVVTWIVDAYHYIYHKENETSGAEESFVEGMLNRETTDGEFGIWGHVLSDLLLHTIYVDENNVITLGVDS